MSIRPILFSGPMVRALLDGRKTQTRRAISFPGVDKVIDFVRVATDEKGRPVYEMKGANGRHLSRPAGNHFVDYHYSPNYAVDDLLYVRESFLGPMAYEANGYKLTEWGNKPFWYIADGTPSPKISWQFWPKARPSIHMPRWASRLTLKVTDVRVQRLRDIGEEDAKAEGVETQEYDGADDQFKGEIGYRDYRDHPHNVAPFCLAETSFASLWNSINEKRGFGWDVNPWVVAVSFKVHRCNVDSFEKEKAA